MSLLLVCIDDCENLTKGKTYKVLDSAEHSIDESFGFYGDRHDFSDWYWIVEDDCGDKTWYNHNHFDIVFNLNDLGGSNAI